MTKTQYVPFRIQMTKRKELSGEPLDGVISIERPGLLYNPWKKLVDKGRLPGLDESEWMGMSLPVLQDHVGTLRQTVPESSAPYLAIVDS